MNYLLTYLGTILAFCAIDALWLGVIMRKTYVTAMGSLMRPDPKWWAAILFYGFFIAALMVFAIVPHADEGAWRVAAFSALFGFACYMTYELTNATIIKGWPISIVVPDILWGAFASAVAGLVGFAIYRALA